MLKDNYLYFTSGILKIRFNLSVTGYKVTWVFFDKKLYVHLSGVVLNFILMIGKVKARVLNLIKINNKDIKVEIRQVIIDN